MEPGCSRTPSPSSNKRKLAVKRKLEKENEKDSKHQKDSESHSLKPPCKYGRNCYRQNPEHLEKFSHDACQKPEKRLRHDTTSHSGEASGSSGCLKSEVPFYLTTVHGIDPKYNRRDVAMDIKDILSLNSDEFVESCQFNYMFDIPWLIDKYPKSSRVKPLLLVHGESGSSKLDLQSDAMKYKNIDLIQAKLPILYGTHHTKMMFLLYNNGCRVVIHTANLIQQDWHQKTQGIWLSPLFSSEATDETDRKDHFKKDLFEYISSYGSVKLSKWKNKLAKYDMTSARVHLVASIPGRHGGMEINKWGHLKLKKVLSEHGPDGGTITCDCPVVGQFSSIGSLGTEPTKWLTSEWLESLSQCRKSTMKKLGKAKAPLKLIFPTMENVRTCLEGYSAGGSLPFSAENAMKQRWMREYLCQWMSNSAGRSVASPHIKTFARLSRDQQSAAWFLVSSANLSKAAWGVYEKNATQLMIRSYEIGVLFIPSMFKEGESMFDVNQCDKDSTKPYLRLPYDLPVTPYASSDKPWIWNIRYTKEDTHGKLWCP